MARRAQPSKSKPKPPAALTRRLAKLTRDQLLQLVVDGWSNAASGLGVLATDPVQSHSFSPEAALEPNLAMEVYLGDDIAARFCDALPFHALRKPIQLSLPGAKEDQRKAIDKVLRDLCVQEREREAGTFARVTGGAGAFMSIDDGRDPSEPVDLTDVDELLSLSVFDARSTWVEQWDEDPDSPGYGSPLTYRIDLYSAGLKGYGAAHTSAARDLAPKRRRRRPGTTLPETRSGTLVVHRSRIALFGGALTPRRQRQDNLGWDDSVLRRFLPVLQEVRYQWQSAAHAIGNAAQAVYGMKDFVEKMGAGRSAEIIEQLRLLNQVRQMRIMPVDVEERFEYVVNALSGVAEIVNQGWERIGAASGWPLTILKGVSPAGLNATGDNDTRTWYDIVDEWRERELRDPTERIVEVVLASKRGPFAGKIPEGWSLAFAPLWQQTDKEKADTQQVTAQADALRLEQRVLTRRQVASRYTAQGFSLDVVGANEAEAAALEAKDTSAALTGIQVQSMQEVLRATSANEIPIDSARAMLKVAFGLADEQVGAMLDPVAKLVEEKRVEAEKTAALQAAELATKSAQEQSAREQAAAEDEAFAQQIEAQRLARQAA